MTSTSSLSRQSELRFGNEKVEKSTWKKISPGRTFRWCSPRSVPPIQLTVEPTPVSRLHRCRSRSFAGGHVADGNRGNYRPLHRGRRRWPTVTLTVDRSVGTHGRMVPPSLALDVTSRRGTLRTVGPSNAVFEAETPLPLFVALNVALTSEPSTRRTKRAAASKNRRRSGIYSGIPSDFLDPRRTPRLPPVRRRGRPPALPCTTLLLPLLLATAALLNHG